MYKYSLLTILFLAPLFAYSQVSERSIEMSVGSHNGLDVDLAVDAKTAEKIWKDYSKPFGKVDWDRKNKEHLLFDVMIAPISKKKLTILTRINEYGDKSTASFLIKEGEVFLNSKESPDEFAKASEFLEGYANEALRHSIREELKDEEGELKDIEKKLKKLANQNEDLHKDIEKAKADIIKKERDVEINLDDQEQNRKEIENQKDKIRKVTIKLANVGKASK